MLYIGLDDTDNDTSPGTGNLARRLAGRLAELGATPAGVTRHQFLVDPRIPYTSHNSGACVAVEVDGGRIEGVTAAALDFVRSESAPGSDPGVCVGGDERLGDDARRFGERAQREIVEPDEAMALARSLGVVLEPLGGTGLGVIGALGSAALRAGGDDGRFIELAGIRELGDTVTAAEVRALDVEPVDAGGLVSLDACAIIRTMGWVRPRLAGGRAVLPLERNIETDEWTPIDRSNSKRRS
jgi:hypothetical protein